MIRPNSVVRSDQDALVSYPSTRFPEHHLATLFAPVADLWHVRPMSGGREDEDTVTVAIGAAVPADASSIASVHVESWRAAYPGMLDDQVLLALSPAPLASYYARRIGRGGMLVARGAGSVIGFASASVHPTRFGAGEIETLYVLPDWQGQGIGRGLLRAAAAHLASLRCGSVYLWVLGANPNRFFYERLRGRVAGHGSTRVGGRSVAQTAYRWDPIDRLLDDRP